MNGCSRGPSDDECRTQVSVASDERDGRSFRRTGRVRMPDEVTAEGTGEESHGTLMKSEWLGANGLTDSSANTLMSSTQAV
jgi:hypothetical protein